MNQSDDYKRGWFDGYQAAKQQPPNPSLPPPMAMPSTGCYLCGLEFKGAMGYVCPNQRCPVQPKITAATTAQQDSEWQKDHERSKY